MRNYEKYLEQRLNEVNELAILGDVDPSTCGGSFKFNNLSDPPYTVDRDISKLTPCQQKCAKIGFKIADRLGIDFDGFTDYYADFDDTPSIYNKFRYHLFFTYRGLRNPLPFIPEKEMEGHTFTRHNEEGIIDSMQRTTPTYLKYIMKKNFPNGYKKDPSIPDDFIMFCKDLTKEKISESSKYSHIDFKPTESVAKNASKGLEYRKKAGGKGALSSKQAKQEGVGSGVQRAVNLKNRNNISPQTIKRMKAFFDRHEKNAKINPEYKNEPWKDKGYVAWLCWGGDAGRTWANKIYNQMLKADEKE